MKTFQVIIFYCLLLWRDCTAIFYPPLFWHKDNCGFRRLDKIKENNVTKEYFMKVVESTGLNVVCPNMATINNWLETEPSRYTFFENLWMVDKHGYDNCMVNEKGDPKINKLLLACDNPEKIKYKLFAFHPRYNVEEPRFAPGEDYYFISTSRGYKHDVSTRKSGGPHGSCKRFNMKLHIHVCDSKKEDCLWEPPRCNPPAELQREMLMIDGRLPAPTMLPTAKPKSKAQKTTKSRRRETTREAPTTEPLRLDRDVKKAKPDKQKLHEICPKKGKGTDIHLILNFVLGGVALFMVVVIIILAYGLSRKSKDYKIERTSSIASSHPEPNKYAYVETLRYGEMQSQLTPAPNRLPIGSPQSNYLVLARAHELVENPYQRTPAPGEGQMFLFPEVIESEKNNAAQVEAPPPKTGNVNEPASV